MREQIVVGVGQCGAGIGAAYWELLCAEHGITVDGGLTDIPYAERGNVSVAFDEGAGGRRVPRALFFDLQHRALDNLRASPQGKLFAPEAFVYNNEGTQGVFSGGYEAAGMDMRPEATDALRREFERCDRLESVIVLHSLMGGAGSGMAPWLLEELRELDADKPRVSISMMPGHDEPPTAIECMNTVLGMFYLIEDVEICIAPDNEGVVRHLRSIGQEASALQDINRFVAGLLSNVTCSTRFGGMQNYSFKKLQTDLIPFPRMHFFSSAYLSTPTPTAAATNDLIRRLFVDPNSFTHWWAEPSPTLTTSILARGNGRMHELQEGYRAVCEDGEGGFTGMSIDWIADGCMFADCRKPLREAPLTLTSLSNTSAIMRQFKWVGEIFYKSVKRRSHMWRYEALGTDQMFFTEAECNMNDLVSEYGQIDHRNCCCCVEEEEGEYEEEEMYL